MRPSPRTAFMRKGAQRVGTLSRLHASHLNLRLFDSEQNAFDSGFEMADSEVCKSVARVCKIDSKSRRGSTDALRRVWATAFERPHIGTPGWSAFRAPEAFDVCRGRLQSSHPALALQTPLSTSLPFWMDGRLAAHELDSEMRDGALMTKVHLLQRCGSGGWPRRCC